MRVKKLSQSFILICNVSFEKNQVGKRRSKRSRKKTLKCLENEKLEKVKAISAILRSENIEFSDIPIYFTPIGRNLNRPYNRKKLRPSKQPRTLTAQVHFLCQSSSVVYMILRERQRSRKRNKQWLRNINKR